MLSAKALYSNVADSPEELSFSQGDILRVLEKDVNGLTGWWLCSVNGRKGIAPGNRLQPITATTHQTDKELEKSARAKSVLTKGSVDRNGSCKQDWHRADKVVVPKKLGDSYVYDNPHHLSSDELQDYDVPPARYPSSATAAQSQRNSGESPLTHGNTNGGSPAWKNHEVSSTRSMSPMSGGAVTRNIYDSPSLLTLDRDHDAHTAASSNSNQGDYEVPPGALLSNRSSMMSSGSRGSSSFCSARSSPSASARSSADVSAHDLYDVAPPARAVDSAGQQGGGGQERVQGGGVSERGRGALNGKPSLNRSLDETLSALKSNTNNARVSFSPGRDLPPVPSMTLLPGKSLFSGLRPSYDDRDSFLDDYSVPRSDTSAGSVDSGVSMTSSSGIPTTSSSGISMTSSSQQEQIYDIPPGAFEPPDDTYDCPRNIVHDKTERSTAKPALNRATDLFDRDESRLYDVPSQITQQGSEGGGAGGGVKQLNNLRQDYKIGEKDMNGYGSKKTILCDSSLTGSERNANGRDSTIHVNKSVTFREPASSSPVVPGSSSKSPAPAVKPKPKIDVMMMTGGEQHFISKPGPPMVQDRPLPSLPPTSLSSECGRQGAGLNFGGSGAGVCSKSDVSVVVCSSVSLSTEWNDECDYVTIANEAERELQRHVPTAAPHSQNNGGCLPPTVSGAPSPAGEGELSVKFKERLAAVQRLQFPVDSSSFDRQAAMFYSSQADLIIVEVRAAAEQFSRSQRTPIDFAPRARSVILSAHKLVYIAEALSRVISSDVSDIVVSANSLCNALKAAVTATKQAAYGFEDATTLRCMENCVHGAVGNAEALLHVIHKNITRI